VAPGQGRSTLGERERKAVRASQLVFEVCDDGPGFAAGVLPRVFEAFQGAGGAERAGAASLGLGLSLVRRIARAHGGRAWVENLAGRGARVAFSVAL
jgi:signal transduction histidine kinase